MSNINFNQAPYWDDFEPLKGFQRILFRPGVAVQARELTQLQTILQHQISLMGDHIFQSGSLVTGGGFHINNNADSVVFKTDISAFALNPETFFIGREIIASNGVKATIKMVSRQHNLFIIQYTAASQINFEVTTFVEGDRVNVIDSSISLEVLSVHKSSIFKIDTGVIYGVGHFIRFPDLSFIVNPFGNTPTTEVGFLIHERIVTSSTDTSLLDNAQGSFNYAAPGAHRLQFTLELVTKEIDIFDERFVMLYRLVNGIVTLKYNRTRYADLLDEFATRMYDKSGHFTIEPFISEVYDSLKLENSEHHKGNTGLYETGNKNELIVKVSPGSGYVRGHYVNKIVSTEIPIAKSIVTEYIENQPLSINIGNFIFVNELSGQWNPQQPGELLKIYDFPASSVSNETYAQSAIPGMEIGTARLYALKYESGDIGTSSAVYRMYLYDINMKRGFAFSEYAKCIGSGSMGFADLLPITQLPQQEKITNFFGTEVENVSELITFLRDRHDYIVDTETYFANDDYLYYEMFQHEEYDNNIIKQKNVFVPRLNTVLYDRNVFPLIYALSQSNVKTLKNKTSERVSATFTYRKHFSVNFNNTKTGIVEINAPNESFAFGLGDLSFTERQNIIVSDKDNGKIYFVRTARQTSNTRLEITIDESIVLANVTVSIVINNVEPIRKIIRRNCWVRIDCSELKDLMSPINLGITDIYRINKITIEKDQYSTLDKDNKLEMFDINNGQSAELYDHGFITPKTNFLTRSDRIGVNLDYFEHDFTQGDLFYSIDSYPINDESNDSQYIRTWEVPIYNNMALRDCIDIRKKKNNTAIYSTSINNSTINPEASNSLFTGSRTLKTIVPDRISSFDIEFYLSKMVVLALNHHGDFISFNSFYSKNPTIPTIQSDLMRIAVLYVAPYPSLPANSGYTYSEFVEVQTINNRRYTESDLRKIDSRLSNVEYYTSLSLLESKTKDMAIFDENHINRFKNGFFVDTFHNHTIGDSSKMGYLCAVDASKGELLPPQRTRTIKMKLLNSNVITEEE